MRIIRAIWIISIISGVIFLGALIVLTMVVLLFWDESSGKKNLAILAVAIPLVTLHIAFHVYILKREESYHRESTLNRLLFQRKASEERKRINELREEGPRQIHAGLNRVLTSNLTLLRMLQSKILIGLFFYIITSLIFWRIFNFRLPQSAAPGLIVGFLAGGIWQRIVRYRIAGLFEREFPAGTPEREAAIEHLSEYRHAYWFASELLKVVGR